MKELMQHSPAQEICLEPRVKVTARHVLVTGIGKSGQATARFLLKYAERLNIQSLTVVDSAQTDSLQKFVSNFATDCCGTIEFKAFLGVETTPSLAAAVTGDKDGSSDSAALYDLCIITPGLAPHTTLSKSAYVASREVISEIELAYRLSPPQLTWIAITGTNGKTTTTELVREVIEAGEKVHNSRVYSVGNIGTPALVALEYARQNDYFVAEVSSFQAARLSDFRPQVAALLNLSSDHLDWHKNIKQYAADKCAIFANCADGDLVLAPDESHLHPQAGHTIAAALDAARSRGAEVQTIQAEESTLPFEMCEMNMSGKHNISNACFAWAIARHFGIADSDSSQAIRNFQPQPHRMQEVGRYGEVLYVNDSKSTNVDASIQALTAYLGLELILLLGGQNKGADYHDLAKAALARAKMILLFGEAASELKASFDVLAGKQGEGQQVLSFASMKDAFCFARENALPQEVVLLSPANASFDEFENFEERGDYFIRLVKDLDSGNDGSSDGSSDG